MGRCPKHPEHIQSGNTCMAWTCKNKWVDKFRCGCELVPLSSDELGEIQKKQTEEDIDKTTLPGWIVDTIKSIAYEEFHSCGQTEVDMYVSDWISRFEHAQDCPSSAREHD